MSNSRKNSFNLQWLKDYVSWDQIGIVLSAVCAVHCILTPFIMLSLPIMARYYVAHPAFHVLIALFILPVGIWAFVSGYRHHHQKKVFYYGLPGLFVIALGPYLIHRMGLDTMEIYLMVPASFALIFAHWVNQKACQSCETHHQHDDNCNHESHSHSHAHPHVTPNPHPESQA